MTGPITRSVAVPGESHDGDRSPQGAGAQADRPTRVLDVPALSLVVLIGATGSGKSTFARRHFLPTEVLSSDYCRGLVSDDENDQSATKDAFDVLHYIVGKRLAAGRLTVVDATNVQPEARRPLVALAREHDVLPVAIVLDVPERECADRNAARPDRDFGPHVLRRQRDQLRRGLRGLAKEGFRTIHVLRDVEEIDRVEITRSRLYNDLRDQTGPFDVIGDVHGCLDELLALLGELGYEIRRDGGVDGEGNGDGEADREADGDGEASGDGEADGDRDGEGRAVGAHHPAGRRAVFLGDLVDRGPDTPGVLRLVMGMVADGDALCVPGNHEVKLLRALRGKNVRVSHGLAESLEQLAATTPQFRARVERFIDGLISHYVLDGGRLVVAHAGLSERLQGRASGRVREFCLYGQTTGETDEYGLPVRYPWAQDYRGRATVLYGHTPVPMAEWVNDTLCLDTGCVFGGRLTALRYPERALVSVPAARVYMEPARPLSGHGQVAEGDPAGALTGGAVAGGAEATRRDGAVLDLTDVLGDRGVQTRLHGRVAVREGNAAAALEVMSRFAIDPRWLLYLPPTMSPVATSTRDGLLEHPEQAFEAYLADGVRSVVCEEKHMGSRAVALICRDLDVARAAFGAPGDAAGAVWTRTGRPFFDAATTGELVARLAAAAERAGLFEELGAGWLLLDAELLPWSAKALELLRHQYAAVGAAARAALPVAVELLEQAAGAGLDVGELLARTSGRAENAQAFTQAYRRYCWPTEGLDGVTLAPFQLLAAGGGAAGGAAFHDRPHDWHLGIADRLVAAAPDLITATRRLAVDCADPVSVAAGVDWWQELTGAGGEGMVVKPAANLVTVGGADGTAVVTDGGSDGTAVVTTGGADGTVGSRRVVQPGLKVRGREYLRIIYGPDYTEPANLERLRRRGLGHKRSMAAREYALGIEALERAVRGEPLWRIHECVFAVLACESEPVDPRL